MANGHGGSRRGTGRPLGAKNLRYKTSAALIEAARIDENLIPVKFEGDSLEFLRATMTGKIWPTREQIYAAKSVLPIEHPPAVTVDGRSVEEIGQAAIREYLAESESQDIGEKLIAAIQRLREEVSPAEHVRDILEETLAARGESDEEFVDWIVGEVEARLPAVGHVDEIIPPAREEPVFSKRSPATIDGETETESAADVENVRVSAADGERSHTSVHSAAPGEPPVSDGKSANLQSLQPAGPEQRVSDDLARAFDQPADRDTIEVAVPTRGPGGSMRYVTKVVPRR
jgi:hypothetical protein